MVRHPPSPPALSRLRRRPPARLATLGLCALLVLAACSRSDEADGPTGTLGTTPLTYRTTTTEAPTPEEAVEAAYLHAMEVFCSYMEDPDQPLDDLRATHTGETLEFITASINRLRKTGERSSYPTGCPTPLILSVEVEDDEATVVACEVNDAVVTASDGTVLNDDVVTVTSRAEMSRRESGWFVATQIATDREAGDQPCDR